MTEGQELPTAQQVLALLAAEHHPFTHTGGGTYCRACTVGTVVSWPCRVHRVASQPTAELVAQGLQVRVQPNERAPRAG